MYTYMCMYMHLIYNFKGGMQDQMQWTLGQTQAMEIYLPLMTKKYTNVYIVQNIYRSE